MDKYTIKLGYVPLTDCLPIIVANELGYFLDEDISVRLYPEVSWATIRDKLTIGKLDAAHLLAPLLFASSLGLSGFRKPLVTAFSFGLNGNAITLSNKLFMSVSNSKSAKYSGDSAKSLAEIIVKREAQGQAPLTFATVFPFSCHYYQIRHWLESAGINTQKQVKFCVLPPQQMVENLQRGHIDGFCVGEPWNSLAQEKNIGHIITSGVEIWGNSPEKVLAVNQEWADLHEEEHAALVRALTLAAQWIENNRSEAFELLVRSNTVHVDNNVLYRSLVQGITTGIEAKLVSANDLHIFHSKTANIPQLEHALFLLKQMQRWGQLTTHINLDDIAKEIYKPDLFQSFMSSNPRELTIFS